MIIYVNSLLLLQVCFFNFRQALDRIKKDHDETLVQLKRSKDQQIEVAAASHDTSRLVISEPLKRQLECYSSCPKISNSLCHPFYLT